MARESFGKTWWGQEWLNSLTHIDYENRIPRGAAYARKGAVTDIKIDGGLIKAKVQGTQRTPYRVEIKVPQVDAEHVARLVDELSEQPLLVSKLMNHELDPQVMTIARKVGIRLFPESWRDLDMRCSCPDWALMCKHVAAVLYGIGTRFDRDPLLFFELRGIDVNKLIDTTLQDRIENMLENADTRTSRMMDDEDLASIFGVL